MKIGRNASCPCGSGRKYKKCCLNQTVTPRETLQYRRLSEVFNKLMPKLIEHGMSVFGEMAVDLALLEFFGWPDPEEKPDEAAIDRAGALFWPWFAFNWEYDRLEDEVGALDGPEEMTIAELFLRDKRIDPGSLEEKMILAANRHAYSFLEFLSAEPGRSVQVRDVLTGAEMVVQERLGSELMEKGDLLFGRAVQIDDIGMFLGLSAVVLPPRLKPQVIRLRRSLARDGKKVTRDDLYEWDMEIREFYLEIDRMLHTPPDLENADGDPLEFHKLVYDIDLPDIVIEKLASLCETETLEEIQAAAEKDDEGKIHHAEITWNRKESPIPNGLPNTILGHIEIEGRRMMVTVNSSRRAELIRSGIHRCLGGAARYRLDEIIDPDAMIEQGLKEDGDTSYPDAELMTHPDIRKQVEQMLRGHWEDWTNREIPLLDGQTPRQAVRTADGRESVEALLLDAEKLAENDPIRSSFEIEIIADLRRRLKLDKPLHRNRGAADPGKVAVQVARIKTIIEKFGDNRLNGPYTGFALDLCDEIAGTGFMNIHRGRVEIWAAAIVFAIAQLNFLFSPETPHHLTTDELCNGFKVKKSTVSNKASTIRSRLELFYGDARFCSPHITQIFRFAEDEQGFIHPAVESNGELDPPLSNLPGGRIQSDRRGKKTTGQENGETALAF